MEIIKQKKSKKKFKNVILILFFVFVVPGLLAISCDYEDACDVAEEKCRDQGLTPVDCEKTDQGCTEECTCKCVN